MHVAARVLAAVTLAAVAVPGCGSGTDAGAGAPAASPPVARMSLKYATAHQPGMIAGVQDVDRAMNTEAYDKIDENPFHSPLDKPLSTFSIDVDTASYANVRRFLHDGALPPPDAVRIEEMVNYFSYAYAEPDGSAPFAVTTEAAACPWEPAHRLARIGLQARHISDENVPPRNLVFLLDVSGSMASSAKLPLLKKALPLLVDNLRPEDRISIVVYAGAAGVVLENAEGVEKTRLRDALEALNAGGSTNGGEGIQRAYALAREGFQSDGINRVILATDGDFNVGTTNQGELVRLIEKERESGIFLTVLGFGTGNVKDLHDGEAGRQGQRQLRVHRLARRGPQGARPGGRRHARDGRQGREDPG